MSLVDLNALIPAELPDRARQSIAGWLHGTISAPITLVRLLTVLADRQTVVETLATLIARILDTCASDSASTSRAAAMRLLLQQHGSRLAEIETMLDFERRHHWSWSGDPVAGCAALFDAWVRHSEEASVALYSLGDDSLLEVATAEVVQLLERWHFLGPERVILQIGCGIGRIEAAVAGRVQVACGIDISGEMIAAARRRCAGLGNVRLMTCSGRDLTSFATATFDGVYAIDTFPYLHDLNFELVTSHFHETHRVLRPARDFLIVNFSYRDAPETDRSEIERLASDCGFQILEHGVQPFKIWDGLAWRLRRTG